jgi:nitrogen regulatory protein P-II 1
MKLVKCIVRTRVADATLDALRHVDLSGFTVTEVAGRGRAPTPERLCRGQRFTLRYVPHTMIDVLVADDAVDDVVRTVMATAYTGHKGDGRVFVLPVEEAYTIRTRAGGPD